MDDAIEIETLKLSVKAKEQMTRANLTDLCHNYTLKILFIIERLTRSEESTKNILK